MPRLTKQDVDAMSLVEVQQMLLRPGDNDVSPSLLFDRKQEILKQRESGVDPDIATGRQKRANALRKSHSVEIESPELPEAKQLSGLVFVDQPQEERPLLVSSGTRIPAFSAAEQSAQEAYDRRVLQKRQRAEEIRLDRVREIILSLGQD